MVTGESEWLELAKSYKRCSGACSGAWEVLRLCEGVLSGPGEYRGLLLVDIGDFDRQLSA